MKVNKEVTTRRRENVNSTIKATEFGVNIMMFQNDATNR